MSDLDAILPLEASAPEDAPVPPPLTPAARARRPALTGTPVVAGGGTWLLAEFAPEPLDPVWDRLFDDNVLRGRYDEGDLGVAGCLLLRANYWLDEGEDFDLVAIAYGKDLRIAVEMALFGPDDYCLSYREWYYGTFFANGLDPSQIPPDMRRAVIHLLIASGKARPAVDACGSARAAGMKASLLGK